MQIHILKEIKPYSFFELHNQFNIDEDVLKEMLKSLSLMNIVKRLSKDTSDIELDELLDSDNLNALNFMMEGNMYVFKFVGMLAIADMCLIVYPKYADDYQDDPHNNFEMLKQLVAVIRKYQSKEQKLGLGEHIDVENFNLLSIALELIQNYYEHGLYSNDKQVIELNGDGNILWEKTINENTAYFSNGIPMYLDTYTVNHENNEADYFRRLHAYVLTEACHQLSAVLGILDIETLHLSAEEGTHFGSKDYILCRINQELSTQFVTFKQTILHLIKRYIEADTSKTVSDNISFVGTNSFNLVWEDVCSVVMDDCINKSIKELGLSYSKNTKQSALLSDVIDKPLWLHEASGKTHVASKTLIPDIVTIKDKELSIYDAKYYKIVLDDNRLNNQPGVGDVNKQYLYELAYHKFAEENQLTIKQNAFLMPTAGKEERKIGSASMSIFHMLSGMHLHDIDIILKPAFKMYELYLNQ